MQVCAKSGRRPARRERGFSMLELGVVAAVMFLMTAVAVPVVLETIRTYRRDAAARHLLGEIRSTQSLATSRNAVFGLQWGPDAGRASDTYRIVRDATGSCSFPAASAVEDGSTVIEDWVDLGDAFSGMTIKSITDSSTSSVGGVMFNPIGASVNTCATVGFPVTIVVADAGGRTRSIEVTSAGSTRLR